MRKFKHSVRLAVLSAVILGGTLGFSTIDINGPSKSSGQVLAIDWPKSGQVPAIDWP
ncbi:hypothetical protein [Streptomyces sp. NBC_01589]|jgi:hypothetical protein|uniref:hypothetical protein n=1 Tax=unclassified Streptomyces TaxID=2593676 RepID=UPI00386EA606